MDAIKYFEEKKRMLNSLGRKSACCIGVNCKDCPLSSFNAKHGSLCDAFEIEYPAKAVAIVEKWAEEHPQKTCLSDFLEKFPEAVLDDEGIPFEICANILGYEVDCDLHKGKCVDCWSSTLEGEVRND